MPLGQRNGILRQEYCREEGGLGRKPKDSVEARRRVGKRDGGGKGGRGEG